MPTPTLQDYTAESLFSKLGISGYANIAAAADGTTATQLDITINAGAYALLKNGSFLDGQLVAATVAGLSTNGTYTLWLDESTDGQHTPVWAVATAAPSTTAISVATVVVASAVISTVTMLPAGLTNVPIATANWATTTTTTAPTAGGAGALPATPLGYATLLINGQSRKVAFY